MKITLTALGLLLAASTWAQAPAQKSGAANNQQQGQGSQTAEESFKKRDANKDNFLTKTEISGSRVADNFDKLDTNKDGKLSLAEYKTGRDAMQGQGAQGQGMGAQGQPGAGQQMQGQNAETRFKENDKNSDGFISKAEVSGSRMADRFDAMDTNKDGKLSLNEMKAGMQNMGGPNGAQGQGMGAAPAATAKKTTT